MYAYRRCGRRYTGVWTSVYSVLFNRRTGYLGSYRCGRATLPTQPADGRLNNVVRYATCTAVRTTPALRGVQFTQRIGWTWTV